MHKEQVTKKWNPSYGEALLAPRVVPVISDIENAPR